MAGLRTIAHPDCPARISSSTSASSVASYLERLSQDPTHGASCSFPCAMVESQVLPYLDTKCFLELMLLQSGHDPFEGKVG